MIIISPPTLVHVLIAIYVRLLLSSAYAVQCADIYMSPVGILWSSCRVMGHIHKASSYPGRRLFHLSLVCRAFDSFRQLLHIINTLCLTFRYIMVQPVTPAHKYYSGLRTIYRQTDLRLSAVLDLPCSHRPCRLLLKPYNQSV